MPPPAGRGPARTHPAPHGSRGSGFEWSCAPVWIVETRDRAAALRNSGNTSRLRARLLLLRSAVCVPSGGGLGLERVSFSAERERWGGAGGGARRRGAKRGQ